jgi:hypothetical protein
MVNKVKNQVPCKHGYYDVESIDVGDPVETIARFSEFAQEHKVD